MFERERESIIREYNSNVLQFPDEGIEAGRDQEPVEQSFQPDDTMAGPDEGPEGLRPDFSIGSVGSTPSAGVTPLRTPGEEVALPPSAQPEVKRGAQKKRLRIDQSTVIKSEYVISCILIIIVF